MRSVDRLLLTDIFIKMAAAGAGRAAGAMAGGMGGMGATAGKAMGTGGGLGSVFKGMGAMTAAKNGTPFQRARSLGAMNGGKGSLTAGFKNTANPGTAGPLSVARPGVTVTPTQTSVMNAKPVTRTATPVSRPMQKLIQNPSFQNTVQSSAAAQPARVALPGKPITDPLAQTGILRPMENSGQYASMSNMNNTPGVQQALQGQRNNFAGMIRGYRSATRAGMTP